MALIRPLVPEDAEELTAVLASNREAFLPVMPDRPDGYYTVAFQRERLARLGEEDGWFFAILDGAAIAGTLNIGDVIRGPLLLANLGYWVDRARHGRGLATRAVAEACAFAFGAAGLHRLEAGTLPDNVASQRVLEKNGFNRYGVARGLVRIAGEWRDHVLFERLATD
ncbi:MAG TPA: GNAT family protein [Gaiellaceae bacterium]|nr:GNAT family protein [Gaiellaceae bacterium]